VFWCAIWETRNPYKLTLKNIAGHYQRLFIKYSGLCSNILEVIEKFSHFNRAVLRGRVDVGAGCFHAERMKLLMFL
jgi:hypothetical protein